MDDLEPKARALAAELQDHFDILANSMTGIQYGIMNADGIARILAVLREVAGGRRPVAESATSRLMPKDAERAEFKKWFGGQDTPEQRGFSEGLRWGWAACAADRTQLPAAPPSAPKPVSFNTPREALLKMGVFHPDTLPPVAPAPGHTDLMVSPEAIEAALAEPGAAAMLDLSARVAALEAGPRWTGEKETLLHMLGRVAAGHLFWTGDPKARIRADEIISLTNAAFPETNDDR